MISTVSSGRVLVTGFGPFGSERVNPSGLIAARLGGVVLPVVAEEAWIMTREEMKRRRARAVLALGVAGGRAHVCVEKQAVNEAAYPIADDAGRVAVHGTAGHTDGMNVLTCLIIGALASGRALAGTSAEVAPAQVHAATGLTLELVADADAVVAKAAYEHYCEFRDLKREKQEHPGKSAESAS